MTTRRIGQASRVGCKLLSSTKNFILFVTHEIQHKISNSKAFLFSDIYGEVIALESHTETIPKVKIHQYKKIFFFYLRKLYFTYFLIVVDN